VDAPELTPERSMRSSAIGMRRFGVLMDDLAHYSGCRSYGALLGEMVVPYDYTLLHRAFFSAPDLIAGLDAVNGLLYRVGSSQTTIVRRVQSRVVLGASDLCKGLDMPVQVLEFRISALLSFVRAWVGDDWHPERLQLPHRERGSAATFERLSNGGSLIYNSDLAGFELPLELALRGPSGEQTQFQFRVRHACNLALEQGCLAEEWLSAFLGVSPRTLRRKLRADGTSLRQIYEELRHERAVLYLTLTQLPILQIASCLGYELSRNFTRAFHRWEGCSPRSYRQSYRSAPSASARSVDMALAR